MLAATFVGPGIPLVCSAREIAPGALHARGVPEESAGPLTVVVGVGPGGVGQFGGMVAFKLGMRALAWRSVGLGAHVGYYDTRIASYSFVLPLEVYGIVALPFFRSFSPYANLGFGTMRWIRPGQDTWAGAGSVGVGCEIYPRRKFGIGVEARLGSTGFEGGDDGTFFGGVFAQAYFRGGRRVR